KRDWSSDVCSSDLSNTRLRPITYKMTSIVLTNAAIYGLPFMVKIIRIVELETYTTLTRKIISTIIKALSSHDNSNTLSILDATYIYSVSLFGPYTRFSILDSLPSNRLSSRRFQFGASNGHAAKLAEASKSFFLSCI